MPNFSKNEIFRNYSPLVSSMPKQPLDESLVRTLLGSEGSRIEHVFGVLRAAKELGPQLGEGKEFVENLALAALYHDIGYAKALRVTGFHPLDGAIFLANQNAPMDVVIAVMLHSGADDEAPSFSGAAESHLYDLVKGMDKGPLVDALTFCDLRTSPLGGPISFGGRLVNMAQRYGPEHPNTKFKLLSAPRLKQMMERVLDRVAAAAPHRLPWVFTDVDSTLVTPGTALSTGNREAMRRYLDNGGRISLATGKHPAAISRLAEELGLHTPHIAGNGSVILQDGKARIIARLGGEAAMQVARTLSDRAIPYAIFGLDGVFIESTLVTEQHISELTMRNEPKPVHASPADWDQIFKVLTYVDIEETATERYLRDLGTDMGIDSVRTARQFLEFVPANVSKGSALAYIVRESSWPPFHTVAIGDSENDISMFHTAGRSLAVANAEPDVLATADQRVAECDDDGVAEALESMIA